MKQVIAIHCESLFITFSPLAMYNTCDAVHVDTHNHTTLHRTIALMSVFLTEQLNNE